MHVRINLHTCQNPSTQTATEPSPEPSSTALQSRRRRRRWATMKFRLSVAARAASARLACIYLQNISIRFGGMFLRLLLLLLLLLLFTFYVFVRCGRKATMPMMWGHNIRYVSTWNNSLQMPVELERNLTRCFLGGTCVCEMFVWLWAIEDVCICERKLAFVNYNWLDCCIFHTILGSSCWHLDGGLALTFKDLFYWIIVEYIVHNMLLEGPFVSYVIFSEVKRCL